jgi:CRISPR-associated protein (TIGR02584 family)
MKIKPTRKVLLCVAGGTPQIITETLWALVQRGELVDEIRVITTREGRDKVRELLLNRPDGMFHQFCRDFPQTARVSFDENRLYLLTDRNTGVPSPRDNEADRLRDILTTEDNEKAANQICEIVRELAQDEAVNYVIHATMAGGRKTMGLYLMAAMQLFGRPADCLSHVLVSPEVENRPDFFYKPPAPVTLPATKFKPEVSTADVEIYLADIPFIRLQGAQSTWLRQTNRLYSEFVRDAQRYLDAADERHQLKINLVSGQVSAGESSATLSEYELLLYTLFAQKRLDGAGEGRDGFIKLKGINRSDLDAALRKITEARSDGFGLERCQSTGEWNFLQTLAVESESSNPVDRERFTDSLVRAIGRANKKLGESRLPEMYEISHHGRRRPYDYGLKVPAQRIVFTAGDD